ncbi:hypothetical protein SAMN05661044_01321 [Olivibacter domesticus]|uniref:Uncharacterized protein n=1 Tax=Olivibacter domesticus TaxID=407022 RepID=A0A1H7KF58_OLID1|nr:hypothetical protein SAMN05661044_01321 [Olivibacter domesticus]
MGWFLMRSENKPILPALDNASEGIESFLAALVKTKAVFINNIDDKPNIRMHSCGSVLDELKYYFLFFKGSGK